MTDEITNLKEEMPSIKITFTKLTNEALIVFTSQAEKEELDKTVEKLKKTWACSVNDDYKIIICEPKEKK